MHFREIPISPLEQTIETSELAKSSAFPLILRFKRGMNCRFAFIDRPENSSMSPNHEDTVLELMISMETNIRLHGIEFCAPKVFAGFVQSLG